MPNTVNLEFAGDASKLAKESKKAEKSISDFGGKATEASDDLMKAGKSSDDYLTKVGKLGAGVEGMGGAVDNAGAALSGLIDLQNAGRERAARLARAQTDVEQAMADAQQAVIDLEQAQNDLNQAEIDGSQATLDLKQTQIDQKQALLDASTAQKDYNDAVKEHGKNSLEARQALIDLDQANQDLAQANQDAKQASADFAQSQTDSTQALNDSKQATIDAKTATLDLADAQSEAKPNDMTKWAEQITMVTPLLSGLIGVTGLVTAAQWAWNAAQLASPTTWIILAIAALVAIIVVIATKTDWFQKAWRNSWRWVRNAAADTWDFLKKIPGWIGTAFSKVAGFIIAPYRAAFNFIADAWNNTVGRLSWTVPGWVPGIGGNTISVPHLPKFHSGGVVPGVPGSETLAILQGGEKVSSRASQVNGGGEEWIRLDLGDLGDALLTPIARAVSRKGGQVTHLGVRVVNGTVRA